NRTNWNTFLAAVHTISKPGAVDRPVRLALAVRDVNDAENRLVAWAKSAGGTAARHPDAADQTTVVAPFVNPAGESAGPRIPGDPRDGRTVTLRLPAATIAMLESVLRPTGAWGA